jgi:prevent-host-death family protein
MKQVNLYEAKTRLSALVDEASAGEEIIIAKNGRPCAKLVPVETAAGTSPRVFGYWGRKYGWTAPDVFPETTEEEMAEWYGGPLFPQNEE